MNFPSEIFGDVIVVHTPDDFGGEQAPGFLSALGNAERRNIVIDLDGTENLASAGLDALLDARDRLQALGGDVKIATTNRYNRKILEMTRLDQQLDVFESVIDAVKAFS